MEKHVNRALVLGALFIQIIQVIHVQRKKTQRYGRCYYMKTRFE